MRGLAPIALIACDPAAVEVVAVEALGPIEQPPEIQGRDGGVSGPFDGRSVWVYGDSVATEAGTYPNTWRNNTMSWTTDVDASDGLDGFVQPLDALGAAREFFPRTLEEEAFNAEHLDDGDCADPCGARYAIWGGGPIPDPAHDRALLTYGKVYAEPGPWNFGYVGISVAVWEDFDAGPVRPLVDSPHDDPTILFDPDTEGEWGPGANVFGDHLYAFSCSGGPWASDACRLARVHLDAVFERSAWEFRTHDGWSDDPDDAVGLFDGSPNMTVHWNEHVGRWLAVYMTWGVVRLRTAPALEGPWSDALDVHHAEEPDPMHAGAHPELARDGGAVEYVSYLADAFRLLEVSLEPR